MCSFFSWFSETPQNNTSEGISDEVCKDFIRCLRAEKACRFAHQSLLDQHAITVHGVPLKGDCYKVSIVEAIKPASFLPIQAGEHKTIGEANKSFVAWSKKLVTIESKVLEPTSDQNNENQPIADQQNEKPNHNKRKKDYTTPD